MLLYSALRSAMYETGRGDGLNMAARSLPGACQQHGIAQRGRP
jgi:hypothetical protein